MLTAGKLIAAVALLTTLVPAVAYAQVLGAGEGAVVEATRTYGVKDGIAYTLGAFKFTGFDATNSAKFRANDNGSRGCSLGDTCVYEAAVMLPAGSQVSSMQLGACDFDPTGQVTAQFYRIADFESPPIATVATVATGVAAAGGCGLFAASGFSETIDNAHNVYGINVTVNAQAPNLAARFWAVRLYYNLQVSPPPATATFHDVPTGHPFFAFIEALAAAGITGGCNVSPPMYCPDEPLTRGQMAVFLGRALGLHFAP